MDEENGEDMAMKWVKTCAAVVATLILTGGAFADPAALKELAPTGKLRVGIAVAPNPGAGNVAVDASGEPRGVGGDLGRALTKKLGIPVQWVPYPNSGALTDALAGGACDVAFLPVDAGRRKKVDFGPPHIVLQTWCRPVPQSKASPTPTSRGCAWSVSRTPRRRAPLRRF
jgi:ABC-type amino acid transport substrate-binding protein